MGFNSQGLMPIESTNQNRSNCHLPLSDFMVGEFGMSNHMDSLEEMDGTYITWKDLYVVDTGRYI